MTAPPLRIYNMDDRGLTAEQIAVTFAMTSRNPEPFDAIARQVTEQAAADFNERWVVGYGHASVAEHAILHLAIENLSRLAADRVLDNRLASYTEKSSRYQIIAPGAYHTPAELNEMPEIRRAYQQACDRLFTAYQRITDTIAGYLASNSIRQSQETERAFRLRLRRRATDASRSILPAATLTNLGCTANARTLEHAISKLLSDELAEVNAAGHRLRDVSQPLAPTLVKYARRNDWLAKHSRRQPAPAGPAAGTPPLAEVQESPVNPFQELATALLLRQRPDYAQAKTTAENMTKVEQMEFISAAMDGRAQYDAPPREFELPRYRLRLRLDYGALREFRRHRMQTCLTAPLTIANGYDTDPLIVAAGMHTEFKEAIAVAEQGYELLNSHCPAAAPYLITHAHYQTVVADINLRECYHLFRLRSGPAAHRGIREPIRAAMRIIESLHPGILQWMPTEPAVSK